MSPAVGVLAVSLRPVPRALTVVRVSVPLSAASVIAPSFVVALVTVRAPLFLISIAPRPVTDGELVVEGKGVDLVGGRVVTEKIEKVWWFAAQLTTVCTRVE